MTITKGKSYEVKTWLANKIAQEIKKNISMCRVFAVLKETEKAVYAMLNLGVGLSKTTWIPKSALVEHEAGEDPATLAYHYEVMIEEDYNTAKEELAFHWSLVR